MGQGGGDRLIPFSNKEGRSKTYLETLGFVQGQGSGPELSPTKVAYLESRSFGFASQDGGGRGGVNQLLDGQRGFPARRRDRRLHSGLFGLELDGHRLLDGTLRQRRRRVL